MTRSAHSRSRGQAVVLLPFLGLLAILGAGLLIDGTAGMSARLDAQREAEAAARAGDQAIDQGALRARGIVVLDSTKVYERVSQYMARTGHAYTVAVIDNDREVAVRVWITQPMRVFSIFGLQSVTRDGSGYAKAGER
jgi:hypothetical protein